MTQLETGLHLAPTELKAVPAVTNRMRSNATAFLEAWTRTSARWHLRLRQRGGAPRLGLHPEVGPQRPARPR